MTVAHCSCGAAMERKLVAALCGPGMPGPIYDLVCSSETHQAEMREQDRKDRAAREEAAIQKAIANGVIDP